MLKSVRRAFGCMRSSIAEVAIRFLAKSPQPAESELDQLLPRPGTQIRVVQASQGTERPQQTLGSTKQ